MDNKELFVLTKQKIRRSINCMSQNEIPTSSKQSNESNKVEKRC